MTRSDAPTDVGDRGRLLGLRLCRSSAPTASSTGRLGLDIGPESTAKFAEGSAAAKTVFWNGPMGVFELAPSAQAPAGLRRRSPASPSFSVVGGGDSADKRVHLGCSKSPASPTSTACGASLQQRPRYRAPLEAGDSSSRRHENGPGSPR